MNAAGLGAMTCQVIALRTRIGEAPDVMDGSSTPRFANVLCRARTGAGVSQLTLAIEAQTSQRHVSRLERGHVHPSRGMVLRLAQALRLSLRQRNHLLEAAGFRAAFPHQDIADEAMTALRSALELMLHQLSPNPAVAADRHWNVQMANAPMQALFAALLAPPAAPADRQRQTSPLPNLMQWIWQPDGLRAHCRNWDEVAPWIWRQLCDDAATADSPVLDALVARHAGEAAPLGDGNGNPVPPMLPLVLDVNGQALRLISLITRFGSPSSATAEEIRIETFIPADAASREILLRLSG